MKVRKISPYMHNQAFKVKKHMKNKKLSFVYKNYENMDIQKDAEEGRIKLNGKKIKHNQVLRSHDFLEYMQHVHEPNVYDGVETIFEDKNIIAVHKPPTMPVYPNGRYYYNTLQKIVESDKNLANLQIRNRLDRDVSGVVVLTKNKETTTLIEKLNEESSILKIYLARVHGEFPEYVDCTEPILNVPTMGFISPDGKKARTEFHRISTENNQSLIMCKLHTGRQHQIRLHLQHLGHPIVNDSLYGNKLIFGEELGKKKVFNKEEKKNIIQLKTKYYDTLENKDEESNVYRDSKNCEETLASINFEEEHVPKDYDEICVICRDGVRFSIDKFAIKLHCFRMKFLEYDLSCFPEWISEDEKKITTNSLTIFEK